MKILVAAAALVSLTISAYAATVPGTIVTTAAIASYSDTAGVAMPQEASNSRSVLVVSAKPGKPVMLTIRSLYQGPSTIGRTIRLFGKPVTDSTGTWMDDGSSIIYTDSTGKSVGKKIRCKLSTVFLASAPTTDTPYIVTGISQLDPDGNPVIIPSADAEMQPTAP